jgi:hypothetical protein
MSSLFAFRLKINGLVFVFIYMSLGLSTMCLGLVFDLGVSNICLVLVSFLKALGLASPGMAALVCCIGFMNVNNKYQTSHTTSRPNSHSTSYQSPTSNQPNLLYPTSCTAPHQPLTKPVTHPLIQPPPYLSLSILSNLLPNFTLNQPTTHNLKQPLMTQ